MFKKMGRPSRKGTATTITFKDPDGETLFFSIDNRGKTNLLFRTPNVNLGFAASQETNSITPSSSSDNLLAPTLLNSCDKYEKEMKQKKNIIEDMDEDTKLDRFLKIIDSHKNPEDFLSINRLSDHMVIPIFV